MDLNDPRWKSSYTMTLAYSASNIGKALDDAYGHIVEAGDGAKLRAAEAALVREFVPFVDGLDKLVAGLKAAIDSLAAINAPDHLASALWPEQKEATKSLWDARHKFERLLSDARVAMHVSEQWFTSAAQRTGGTGMMFNWPNR